MQRDDGFWKWLFKGILQIPKASKDLWRESKDYPFGRSLCAALLYAVVIDWAVTPLLQAWTLVVILPVMLLLVLHGIYLAERKGN